ncbi:MAG: flagellar filament capping protein FliD [Syntrophobacteraceae bacterium]|nr:flagellar filament capping protein FliD [Syntrophobacteraceae bacterium]
MSTTSSTSSNLSLTSLGTGIDWQSIVSQLTQASEQELTPYNNEISAYNTQLSAWGTMSSDLSALQTSATTLASPTGLSLYTANVTSNSSTSASSLLSATASSSANTGTYNVVVNSVAQAQKLGSSDFSSQTTGLNLTGNFLVNDQAVSVASTDTLQTLQTKINALDTGSNASGVTASIVQNSSKSFRLVLSSDTTGANGISLLNGDTNNVLESLGFNGSGAATVKNQVTGGAQSDGFTDTSTAVGTLLGIGATTSGAVTINGKSVTLNLSDSLSGMESALNTAGLSASIVSSTSGSTTKYSLQITGGINSFSDNNNVLQNMGFIQGDRASQTGVTSGTANTTDGSTPITAATPLTSIYGYNTWTSGDSIALTGTDHSGNSVSSNFSIGQTSTVGDLLNQIDSAFGNVTASVGTSGQIQVVDNATGTSKLSLGLAPTVQDPNSTLGFGAFGAVGTLSQHVLQQGADASFSIDGMNLASSNNTVTSAISGVTLNLLGASPGTNLTLNVAHDTNSIESQINSMISSFNSIVSAINTQNTYNATTNTTGGPLFGDPVLQGLKSQLESTVLNQTGSGNYNSMPAIGITVGANGLLSLDTSTFESAVSTDFQAVSNIFQDSGTSSNPLLSYASNTSSTKSGAYAVDFSSNSSGTIDGQTATGNGNSLSLGSSQSGANGLVVSYSGNTYPANATITVNRGIASLLNDLVNSYTSSAGGIITTENTGINSSITGLQQLESNMQTNINTQMASLSKEYQNMNTAVAQLDQMQSYLTTQLANL